MKIFNIGQANTLLINGAKAIGTGTGNRFKVYIEFEENIIFKDLLKKWLNREI